MIEKQKLTSEQFAAAEEEFFSNLNNLMEKDKQGIGLLRRAAGCTIAESRNAYIPFYKILPNIYHNSKYEELFFLIATLFAMNKNNSTYGHGKDFGFTMAQVYKARETDSLQKQFAALLDATFDTIDRNKMGGGEVTHRLFYLVKLANTNSVPIDWRLLFKGLKFWDQSSKSTQKQWARSFYGFFTPQKGAEDAEQEEPNDQDESEGAESE
jgi:CRISPR type I-E-associated protein CasB/Cse2